MALVNFVQGGGLADLNRQVRETLEQQNILLLMAVALRRRRNRRREREQAAQRARRPRRWWVKPWVRTREMHSQYRNVFERLEEECHGDYMTYVRMDQDTFTEILHRVEPRLRKCPRWVQVFIEQQTFP